MPLSLCSWSISNQDLQLLHWVALRRHQLVHLLVLLDRVHFPVVPAHSLPQVVRQVQLRSCRCSRRWNTGALTFFDSHLDGIDGIFVVMVFLLSFAVFGAAGNSHLFPQWSSLLFCDMTVF